MTIKFLYFVYLHIFVDEEDVESFLTYHINKISSNNIAQYETQQSFN